MPENLSGGESSVVIHNRNPEEPTSRERDLFAHYGPCPECGEETITYSKEFEESDLTCYTCGHWLDYHEAATTGADSTGEEETSTSGVDVVLERLRSLF